MDKVDIKNIHNVKKSGNSITFDDAKNEYSFSLSKSTLFKRFVASSIVYEFDVEILEDPLLELNELFSKNKLAIEDNKEIKQTIYLPLYGKDKNVSEKSSLNQRNAGGRLRNINEVYISVPAIIHKKLPDFFPNRETAFTLILPDGSKMKSKICQDGGKALMSYSNKELGKRILRTVLNLKEGELLTYNKLQRIGVDSVRIDKINDLEFEINFAKIDSYEEFKNEFM